MKDFGSPDADKSSHCPLENKISPVFQILLLVPQRIHQYIRFFATKIEEIAETLNYKIDYKQLQIRSKCCPLSNLEVNVLAVYHESFIVNKHVHYQ
jgi:hypothetical protein